MYAEIEDQYVLSAPRLHPQAAAVSSHGDAAEAEQQLCQLEGLGALQPLRQTVSRPRFTVFLKTAHLL